MHAMWGRTLSATHRRVRLRTLAAGVALVVPLGLAGCSDDVSGLAAEEAVALHGRVAAVRAAAALENPDAAHTAVARFRADVARLVETGSLDPAQAMALLAHADEVAADIDDDIRTAAASPAPQRAAKKARSETERERTRPAQRARTSDRVEMDTIWAVLRERIADRIDEERRERDRERPGRDDRERE